MRGGAVAVQGVGGSLIERGGGRGINALGIE